MHAVGFALLLFNAFFLSVGLPILLWFHGRRIRPEIHETRAGIHIHYEPGAQRPWPFLPTVLHAATLLKPQIKGSYVCVYPYGSIMPHHETGYVDEDDRPVPAPRTVDEAQKVFKITGTTERVRTWFLSPWTYIIHVEQLPEGVSEIDIRLSRGYDKPLAPAQASAIAHEIAQHVAPQLDGVGPNTQHALPKYQQLEAQMNALIREHAQDSLPIQRS